MTFKIQAREHATRVEGRGHRGKQAGTRDAGRGGRTQESGRGCLGERGEAAWVSPRGEAAWVAPRESWWPAAAGVLLRPPLLNSQAARVERRAERRARVGWRERDTGKVHSNLSSTQRSEAAPVISRPLEPWKGGPQTRPGDITQHRRHRVQTRESPTATTHSLPGEKTQTR